MTVEGDLTSLTSGSCISSPKMFYFREVDKHAQFSVATDEQIRQHEPRRSLTAHADPSDISSTIQHN